MHLNRDEYMLIYAYIQGGGQEVILRKHSCILKTLYRKNFIRNISIILLNEYMDSRPELIWIAIFGSISRKASTICTLKVLKAFVFNLHFTEYQEFTTSLQKKNFPYPNIFQYLLYFRPQIILLYFDCMIAYEADRRTAILASKEEFSN